jgi:hypothetical protein
MLLERGFGAARLNTGTMTAHSTLAATLIANFRTIRFPWSDACSMPPAPSHSDWWRTAKARRAHRLAVDVYRRELRQRLAKNGSHLLLDLLEADPDGGWRLHIFVADDLALSILADISERTCGPGDPVDFDPEEFVMQRIGGLGWMDSDSE